MFGTFAGAAVVTELTGAEAASKAKPVSLRWALRGDRGLHSNWPVPAYEEILLPSVLQSLC